MSEFDDLKKEAEYWNKEYELCFGINPAIAMGDPMSKVHTVQSKVVRHYVEEMKKVLGK